ncbi:glutaredoxin family protein [Oceanobacillus sp. 1P07AA]|uniref:glutaredoxin family protein n=1 Tax=Oceanobacillus sp. 1P07AA TaxID=3132293 RepID=UPI0039A47759
MKNEYISFYTKENCPLCVEAEELLIMLNKKDIPIIKKDIYSSDELLEKYQLIIPVIEYNQTELFGEQLNIKDIDRLLNESNL